VSSVFNAMMALSVAAPAALGRLVGARRAVASAAAPSSRAAKTWQMVAVRTGTVGAIAAGGVAAYKHRQAIMRGVRGVGSLNRESVVAGYKKGVDSIGQGLAYINRGNVGRSFAWLSDHFTFVGALLKPNELARRLERTAALRGVGVKDFYVSLGETGYWSGGYFVPERTFCAIPEGDKESKLFERVVMAESEDEVVAHMTMFVPKKNKSYGRMKEDAAEAVVGWFLDDSDVFDDPKLREAPRSEEEVEEDKEVEDALHGRATKEPDEKKQETDKGDGDDLDAESPIDIAAAASLVPLPDDGLSAGEDTKAAKPREGEQGAEGDSEKQYLQYLFGVAQQAGSGIRGWMPSSAPNVQVPAMPSVVSSLKQVNLPNMSSVSTLFSKKADQKQGETPGGGDFETGGDVGTLQIQGK
jgi:hypothetical protein